VGGAESSDSFMGKVYGYAAVVGSGRPRRKNLAVISGADNSKIGGINGFLKTRNKII
jgi:hypothetical protein